MVKVEVEYHSDVMVLYGHYEYFYNGGIGVHEQVSISVLSRYRNHIYRGKWVGGNLSLTCRWCILDAIYDG